MAIILTGDRPTGNLHLGHYVGSLSSRLALQQKQHQQYIMIADVQALTDNFADPTKVRQYVYELAKDYLAVGLTDSTIFIQSQIPELTELTMYYLNLVTLARLERNPTVKNEVHQKGYGNEIPAGFLCYPVSQAADITAFKANLVPAGQDQIPMIEQTNEIVRKFNRIYHTSCLQLAEIYLSNTPKLMGIDGKAKMSKSLSNAIYLADSPDVIKQKVFAMFTDPSHLKVSDPGQVEGNVVFSYLDVFYHNSEELQQLKEHYRRGGLGDTTIKSLLNNCLQELLTPIRERRNNITQEDIEHCLLVGTKRARATVQGTLHEVRQAMRINYFI